MSEEGTVSIVSVEKLRTSYARLRSEVPSRHDGLSTLPIRVTPCQAESGYYDVIDGFKRLRAACDEGQEALHVVVEVTQAPKEAKRLLLQANAPRKTVSPMDEARVVKSLMEDDGLTLTQAARLLGRQRSWASKRYTLATRLDRSLQKALDEKRLGVSVAYTLSAFDSKEQVKIANAIFQGGLSVTNADALISTYRSLDSDSERDRLLRDPMGTLDEIRERSKKPALALSSAATTKLDRYRLLGKLLEEFLTESIPLGASPGEARLLEAERAHLKAKIMTCAQELTGVVPASARTEQPPLQEVRKNGCRHDSRGLPFEEKRHGQEGDCEEDPGRNVKTVRRILKKHLKTKEGNAPPEANEEAGTTVPQERPQNKLAPYYDAIGEKVEKGLTGARILREIRKEGYTGGRTILQDHLRKIRPPTKVKKRVFRRFETEPSLEAQVDWSPFRVMIGGCEKIVHCFAMILCYSRMLFLQFHRDERLPTLLEAHVSAFESFHGVTRRVVYDNMSTVTFGRKGRDIMWNPEFLKFAQHYAYEPVLCRIADPNRKGKIEIVFRLVEQDFLRGREFASWEDLDHSAAAWLTEIANRRCHGTTRQVPEDMWLMERDFLPRVN